jgi:hypothetical protein
MLRQHTTHRLFPVMHIIRKCYLVRLINYSIESQKSAIQLRHQRLNYLYFILLLFYCILHQVSACIFNTNSVPFSCHAVTRYDEIWLVRRLGMGIGLGFMIVWHESITTNIPISSSAAIFKQQFLKASLQDYFTSHFVYKMTRLWRRKRGFQGNQHAVYKRGKLSQNSL